MALLSAALPPKGWCNCLFHFAIREAIITSFFPVAEFRCALYTHTHTEVQSLQSGYLQGIRKQLLPMGKPALHRFLETAGVLNSAITLKMLSRQALQHVSDLMPPGK